MVALVPWWTRIVVTLLVAVVAVWAGTIGSSFGSDAYFLLAFYVIIVAAHYSVEALRPGGSIRASGLGLTPSTPKQLALGMSIGAASLLVVVLVGLSLGAYFTSGSVALSWSWVGMMILASIGEEVLFRGTIFEALRERFRPNVAVGVTAVLFGLAHAGNSGSSGVAVINVTCAGILFGAMVVRTSSLWMSIGYHLTWNLMLHLFIGSVSGSSGSGVVLQLVTSDVNPDIRWIIDGPFGIEQGLVTTIVLTAGIVATAGWARPDRYVRAAKLRRMRREHELSRPG